ncbi:MAG: hypothetical protein ISS57_15915 [Anaerolineales bacterium]|nr:hypothetical protein [Anaerolineales bacterium]
MTMDIFFTDPSDVPLPPDEVRIRQFKAEPWPDGRRVKIYLEVTPFQKYPSGEVVITDISGQPVATASIIETIAPKMEINMHLRTPEPSGEFSASVVLFYLQEFEEEQDGEIIAPPERMIVDEAQTSFEID